MLAWVIGIDTVVFTFRSREESHQVKVKDISHAPDFKFNLLSVNQLAASSSFLSVKHLHLSLSNKQLPLISEALYILCALSIFKENNSLSHSISTSSHPILLSVSPELWHQHMVHASHKRIIQLSKVADSIFFTHISDYQPCVRCAKDKAVIKAIHSGPVPQFSKLLYLVHSDLCRPISISSIAKAKYIALFCENHSRSIYIYLIKAKSDYSSILGKFVQYIFNQFSIVIKIVHSDKGEEFVNQTVQQVMAKWASNITYPCPFICT